MAPAAAIGLVGLGGMCGSIARYLVQNAGAGHPDKLFLTLAVNIAGSIAIGAAWVLLSHFSAGRWANALFVGGFLGGFTTFSAFSLDVMLLLRDGRAAMALLYGGLSVAGGILGCAAGIYVTHYILERFRL